MKEYSDALEIAAGAWCTPETSHIVMIPELAVAFADIIFALNDNLTCRYNPSVKCCTSEWVCTDGMSTCGWHPISTRRGWPNNSRLYTTIEEIKKVMPQLDLNNKFRMKRPKKPVVFGNSTCEIHDVTYNPIYGCPMCKKEQPKRYGLPPNAGTRFM